MNMQIKNNFITGDENVMKHLWWKRDETLVIFNCCFIEFQSHPPDTNRALQLAYNVMNY